MDILDVVNLLGRIRSLRVLIAAALVLALAFWPSKTTNMIVHQAHHRVLRTYGGILEQFGYQCAIDRPAFAEESTIHCAPTGHSDGSKLSR